MTINKAYTSLRVLPPKVTVIDMPTVINYIQNHDYYTTEEKRMAYIIFRNESLNGHKGINNNYIGFQCDGGVWPSQYTKYFIGYCIEKETLTCKERGFLCFSKWQDSIDIILDEVENRKMYIGGNITSPYVGFSTVTRDNICRAYEDLWVYGNKEYIPTKIEIKDFDSMYEQATLLFK